jgi:adhesin/invasin
MRPYKLLYLLGGVAAVILLHGCTKKAATTGPIPAAGIVVVQGNNQTAQAGKELPTPVILRVVDKSGVGIAGLAITLALGDGGGTITPPSAVSDAKGEIKAIWTLGPSIPAQTLFASAPGVDLVKLSAVAILPSDVIVAQGNFQTAKAGTALPNSIVIRVVGAGNVPLVGVTVALQITGGGGAISPQTSVTSALGEVTAKWTLGSVPAVNTATISVSTLSNVQLTATGTP